MLRKVHVNAAAISDFSHGEGVCQCGCTPMRLCLCMLVYALCACMCLCVCQHVCQHVPTCANVPVCAFLFRLFLVAQDIPLDHARKLERMIRHRSGLCSTHRVVGHCMHSWGWARWEGGAGWCVGWGTAATPTQSAGWWLHSIGNGVRRLPLLWALEAPAHIFSL
jgi:hypothetical protein